MPRRPLIGLNADFRPATRQGPPLCYLHAGYFTQIERAGGTPVIVPPQEDEAEIARILDLLDGFVLIGGADLDPRRDGYQVHSSMKLLDPKREKFDRAVMRMIGERRMPVFGIGAGMQLLNLSQGGSLYYHIPEDLPDAIPHKDPQDPEHRHSLNIVMGTLMERVYGDGEIRVASSHHMAIDETAPGFCVTARCPDGVIEAIESTQDDWFAMGVQFHPESESASALDARIFEEFIEGVQKAVKPTKVLQ